MIMLMLPASWQESNALRQVAGNITVDIQPGQTKSFAWGLFTDKNQSNYVNISSEGLGAAYLALPKNISLLPGEPVNVQGKVSIPFDHPGGVQLNATLRASEPSEKQNSSGSTALVNVEMGKRVYIFIEKNPFPEFRDLIFRPYMEKVNISSKEVSIPIESTSNITNFSFNQNNKSIGFKVTGHAGTNGTTIIYPGKLLEPPYFLAFSGTAYTEYESVLNKVTGEKGIKLVYPHDIMHQNFSLSALNIITPN
jgi:hypothetical protein